MFKVVFIENTHYFYLEKKSKCENKKTILYKHHNNSP